MKLRKIIASALALMLAVGTITVLPADYAEEIGIGITAEAANNDFIIGTDDNGNKCIVSYTGKGGDITLPANAYVVDSAFKNNTKITSVTCPGTSYIGTNAFANCVNLKKVTIDSDVCIDMSAFSNCINLKEVSISGSISNAIYPNAFSRCYSLEKVSIAKNEKNFVIGAGAFFCCYSLNSINIPSKCTEIYGTAFSNCPSLEKITIPSKTKLVATNDGVMQHFGYFSGAKTEADALNSKWFTFLADGKTSAYTGIHTLNSTQTQLVPSYKKYTPKKLTMIVTKGSDAEKYAKDNKITYKYASASKKTTDKLAAPAGFKASKSTTKITLKWNAVDGADAYRVYIYNAETGKYEKYKTVKSAKCTISDLTKGTKYKFKVVALDKVDGKYKAGETSKAVAATTKSK